MKAIKYLDAFGSAITMVVANLTIYALVFTWIVGIDFLDFETQTTWTKVSVLAALAALGLACAAQVRHHDKWINP